MPVAGHARMLVLSVVACATAAARSMPVGGRRTARSSFVAVDAVLGLTATRARGSARLCAAAGPLAEAHGDTTATLRAMTTRCTPASAEDVACIEERQLRHPISAMVAVGKRCKYGFPQALALDPLGREKYGLGGHPIDAALFRLTCPHLVKGIDEWEAQGAVRAFNEHLAASAEWTQSNDNVNAQHRQIRRALVGSAAKRAELEASPVHAIILNSGLAGLTKQGDVKCLHAQVADGLCRGDNAVADAVLDGLRARGVDPEGGCSCWQQCDRAHAPGPESWRYQPAKNRQKLKATAERRRRLNDEARHRQLAVAARAPRASRVGVRSSEPAGADQVTSDHA